MNWDSFDQDMRTYFKPRKLVAVATLGQSQDFACADIYGRVHLLHISHQDMVWSRAPYQFTLMSRLVEFMGEIVAAERIVKAGIDFEEERVKRRTMNMWG